MYIQSLGYRTDLFFARFDGEVEDRGDHLVIRTPSNPTFHWSNFLLFAKPPGPGDLDRWQRFFAEEIGTPPVTEHLAFGWDSITGERGNVQPFLDAGLHLDTSVVLTAQEVSPPPQYNREIVVRPLREDWEWEGALQNQIACRGLEYSLEEYTSYMTRKMARYRIMAEAGLGGWFGAFLDDRMVGDLGVFIQGGVGRFQSVGTHLDYRRRGICGTLVYEAARHALTHLGAEMLVMVADPEYHAVRIYDSVGFRPTEHQIGMDWWQRDEG